MNSAACFTISDREGINTVCHLKHWSIILEADVDEEPTSSSWWLIQLLLACPALCIINGQMPLLSVLNSLQTANLYPKERTLECLCSASWECQHRKPRYRLKDGSRSCFDTVSIESLSHTVTFNVIKKAEIDSSAANSHEAQLGLPAYQDLSQALDTSHFHLNLFWSHGALCHGHIWMTWEAEGVTAGMSRHD